ncbi:terpene synthase family protein [Streptomyces sp. L500]
MPARWLQRLRTHWLVALSETDAVAQPTATGNLPAWDDYLSFRRSNLYIFQVTMHCEMSVGIDMTGLLIRHPELQDLELLVADYVVFHNDLYSLPKEARNGNAANAFWILRRDGASVQEAVDTLAHFTLRYFGTQHDGTPVRAGTMTITEAGGTFTPVSISHTPPPCSA